MFFLTLKEETIRSESLTATLGKKKRQEEDMVMVVEIDPYNNFREINNSSLKHRIFNRKSVSNESRVQRVAQGS